MRGPCSRACVPSPAVLSCATYVSCCLLAKMDERDRIAVMFCGSHKTLAFGIPLIKVCYNSIGLELGLLRCEVAYAEFSPHCF